MEASYKLLGRIEQVTKSTKYYKIQYFSLSYQIMANFIIFHLKIFYFEKN